MAHDARPIPAQDQQQPLTRANGLVLVLDTPKGRGVFASHGIEQGTVIEISPVLIFSPTEVKNHLEQTCLNHYTYNWPSSTFNSHTPTQALALGLGSLFNHSTLHQNVGWRRDLAMECIVYTALRDIAAGEELCISYGNGRLWFEDADGNQDDENDNKEHARTTRVTGQHGDDEHGVDGDTRQPRGVLEMSGLSGIDPDLG
ncbi:hypothetical protein DV738_g2171, partial [Chaetothyriales sp. CBS 135597]